MLNKQIFEIETGKLLLKDPSEKMVSDWEGITFSVVTIFVFFICFFLLAFVFVVAVVVVCLFVYLFFPGDFYF